jgi:CheY-like chemotaxis protein
MAKILLVEDDNNLREIYEARLMAEGYDIVSARDGEEALTVAMKEKPDLIISDVMMPKISGFDMLDILRTTEETKNVKIIMMTALSQAEDKARAEKLGADRYLVKSQVTLEDVAKVAKEVLEGTTSPEPAAELTSPSPIAAAPAAPEPAVPEPTTPAPEPAMPVPAPSPLPAPKPVVSAPAPVAVAPAATMPAPVGAPEPQQASVPAPVATPNPVSTTAQTEEEAIAQQIEGMMAQNTVAQSTAIPAPMASPQPATTMPEPNFIAAPVPAPAPQVAEPAMADPFAATGIVTVNEEPSTPAPITTIVEDTSAPLPEPAANPNSSTKRVIEPLNDLSMPPKSNINDLLAQENMNEAAAQPQPDQSVPVQPAPITAQPSPPPAPTQQPQAPASPSQNNVDPNSIAL